LGIRLEAEEKKARVVLVRDKEALDNNHRPNALVIGQMLDRGVTALLDVKDPATAWAQLVKPSDLVGIKSNVWSPLPTFKEVEEVLKTRIIQAGVPAKNIRIDDRGAIHTLAHCTALINVRPLRTHHWSGIGGCIKNYIMFIENPADYHPDSCADLAAIWQMPIVKGKTRLNVLLLLRPQFYGRGPHHYDPRYVWDYKGILVSKDPVAADTVGIKLLEIKRRLYFGEDRPLTTVARHVAIADRRYKLGVSDLKQIELIRLGWMDEVLLS